MTSKANGKAKVSKKEALFSPDEMKLLKPILSQNPPIVELSIEVLNTDYSYQERPRERIVNQVATLFSEALLGVLIVGQRPDHSYWVCDGESRRQGIIRRGETKRIVKCLIYQTEGSKQEALLFAWFNSKRAREPTNLATNLNAYGVAGTDHGFKKAVEECGFCLLGRSKRVLRGPGYAVKAWDLDGDGTSMRKALFAMKEAWKDNHTINGYMVLGVARLYHYARRTVDDQVRQILRRTTPDQIMEWVAKRYASAGGKALRIHPDEKPILIARVLADRINKNPGKAGKIDVGRLDESRPGA
jgi:hypothetical protein